MVLGKGGESVHIEGCSICGPAQYEHSYGTRKLYHHGENGSRAFPVKEEKY